MNHRYKTGHSFKVSSSRGFTMIELMLAMGFVAILLLAVAMTTIHITNIYNKGITLRAVNQTGQAVTSDLNRAIATAQPFKATASAVAGPDINYIDVPDRGGRLCLGGVGYAWNYAAAFLPAGSPLNVYDTGEIPRFVRVSGNSANLCSTLTPLTKSTTTELLSAGDRDLVLHQFSLTKASPTPDTNHQALYHIIMTIGTSGKQGSISSVDYRCQAPTTGDGFETFCAVNQFDFVARASST